MSHELTYCKSELYVSRDKKTTKMYVRVCTFRVVYCMILPQNQTWKNDSDKGEKRMVRFGAHTFTPVANRIILEAPNG